MKQVKQYCQYSFSHSRSDLLSSEVCSSLNPKTNTASTVGKIRKVLFFVFLFFLSTGRVSAFEKEVFTGPAGQEIEVMKGYILVKFKSNILPAEGIDILKADGFTDVDTFKRPGAHKVKVTEGKSVNEMVSHYSEKDDVEYAEPIYILRALKLPDEYRNSSEMKERQWGLDKIDAELGWDVETGEDVVVAVVDTGIDLDHPELDSRIWDNPDTSRYEVTNSTYKYIIKNDHSGWNFASGNNDPDDDDLDTGGHGTHCAGIIGAEMNNSSFGVVGVSWKNKLMAVKVLDEEGSGYSHDVANGIIYAADRGADVISLSLGTEEESEIIKDAVNYAYKKGCVIVAASGNAGKGEVFYPAGYKKVIAVGMTNKNDEKHSLSNYGKNLDVVAPGVKVYSTLIGGYGELSGTSMACPHVAGLASLIISFWEKGGNKSWTPDEVRNVITSNCDDINSDAYSGWDKHMGYGRINIDKVMTYINKGVVNVSDDDILIYPNPFDPAIQKALIVMEKNYQGVARKLRIYSLDGQLVRETGVSGTSVSWDGKNDEGSICAPGLYFFYLDTTTGSEKGKITLIR